MRVYYNEVDSSKCSDLRKLIKAGLLPKGDIDNRSIALVEASDLRGYDQCHFFAGMGAWAEATKELELTGPIWTGSCPCQPFSDAGLKKGEKDDRHLFPVWHQLITQCKPAVVFGEQVASKAGLNWLDNVCSSMERCGYAFSAAILPAAAAGAPHERKRTYFSAVENSYCLRGTRTVGVWSQAEEAADNSQHPGNELRLSAEYADSGLPVQGMGFWRTGTYIESRSGVLRPIQPGLVPVANGGSKEMGQSSARLIKLYGDAIVLPLAREFVLAAQDAIFDCYG